MCGEVKIGWLDTGGRSRLARMSTGIICSHSFLMLMITRLRWLDSWVAGKPRRMARLEKTKNATRAVGEQTRQPGKLATTTTPTFAVDS